MANACRVCGAVAGVERRLALLARMQHAVVTRAQLLAIGFTRETIDRRIKSGRFRALHRGVYLVAPVEPPLAALSAAHLACGTGAALAYRSAVELHGYLEGGGVRQAIDVAVPRPRRTTSRRGIAIHSVEPWLPGEVVKRERLPVTAPLRTILDFASVARRIELEQAVATAIRRRRAFTQKALVAAAKRRRNRRGMPLLLSVLTGPARPAFTRSQAERMLLELIRAARLPLPESNVPVGDPAQMRYEADLLWREHGLIVEFDSVEFHGDERSFHADRARDAYLLTLGYRVMRITWEQLVAEPEVVIARIAGALAAGRPAA